MGAPVGLASKGIAPSIFILLFSDNFIYFHMYSVLPSFLNTASHKQELEYVANYQYCGS
jgi:hypothetical protein